MNPGISHVLRRPGAKTGRAASLKRGGLAFLAGLFLSSGAAFSQAQWNLPYARPASYDYSNLYADNLKTFLGARPSFFKDELKDAWGYWKQNFMMSSGLVNHRRLQGTTVIGTNEAVSEGQGYGMLLAVLLNDQATFNKIFQAANTNMWDNGRKSYNWTWPSGSSGAATDADLDIGLALVFADEMVKAKFWQAYNQGGMTYQSRAMEIIKSIRGKMTANDFLLPGDTWGGEGVNNLNPSYFATAWLKVFNAYQNEVDFTPVINSCYAVLAKVPRYNQGQAPDWCNSSGGQASQAGGKPDQGMGMLSDGIRTPWRIGMDALWFKDPRAIQYCKNTMNTLTQYNNSNFALLAAQMAHYSRGGTVVAGTDGSFDNMTMWMTAILGSGEAAYTKKGTDSQLLNRIVGNSLTVTHLGSVSLQDDKFYYKQSIAMLGLAAIGGHFPNIQADAKVPVGLAPAPEQGRNAEPVAGRLFRNGSTLWFGATDEAGNRIHRNALGRSANLLR
jgi:endo-1,4-beta-D-glucanase Y